MQNHNNGNSASAAIRLRHGCAVGIAWKIVGNRDSADRLTMMYLGRHGGGGYGIHHGGGDIAGAVGRRRGVVLRRRIDAEGRHEFRGVHIESGEFALDRCGLAVLR